MSEKKTRQLNMRLAPGLIDAVDRARSSAEPGPDGKPPSRTLWIERAIKAFLPKSLVERLSAETAGPAPEQTPAEAHEETPVASPVPSDPAPPPPDQGSGSADPSFEELVAAREKRLASQIPSKLMRRKIAEKDVREGWRP